MGRVGLTGLWRISARARHSPACDCTVGGSVCEPDRERGLAFQLEHGFFTTERGKNFMLNLQQITDAIHTTAYFGVIHALLTGKTFYKEWRKNYSTPPSVAEMFCCARATPGPSCKRTLRVCTFWTRAKHESWTAERQTERNRHAVASFDVRTNGTHQRSGLLEARPGCA